MGVWIILPVLHHNWDQTFKDMNTDKSFPNVYVYLYLRFLLA